MHPRRHVACPGQRRGCRGAQTACGYLHAGLRRYRLVSKDILHLRSAYGARNDCDQRRTCGSLAVARNISPQIVSFSGVSMENTLNAPLLNITIPVLNRYHLTQKTLLALHKTIPFIKFSVTVVDNGSDLPLQQRLIEFKKAGIIDNLFILPCNMGISVACNIGWKAVDAAYYMKLDNDMVAVCPDWLEKLFRLWSHGQPLSTLGPALCPSWLRKNPGAIETPDGILGICATNLPGGAIIIPKTVSDILGMWSEDYGLYGAEDGDYGARMQAAGFPQYYYDVRGFFEHQGGYGSEEYKKSGLDKQKEHSSLFNNKEEIGTFMLNFHLYNSCIRNWKIPLRYRIKDIDGYNVILEENEEYKLIQDAIRRSKLILNNFKKPGKYIHYLYKDTVIMRLKKIWKSCGQECIMK